MVTVRSSTVAKAGDAKAAEEHDDSAGRLAAAGTPYSTREGRNVAPATVEAPEHMTSLLLADRAGLRRRMSR